jgi:cytidine deaminase
MFLLYLTFNKKITPCSLKTQHLTELLQAFKLSILNLKQVMNTSLAELVPEVLEEEFNNFKH